MSDFWSGVALAQIATALVLIAAFLMYIAYRVSKPRKSR